MSAKPEPMVYVVDDDLSVRRSMGRLLRCAGFQVETFASAREFLAYPRRDVPACLVLDVRMPDLGGLELQRELNRLGNTVPVIFITAHGDIPMSVRAMKAGAFEFLTKPFQTAHLLEAIRQALARDAVAHEERMEVREVRARYKQLTPREREVMALITAGRLNKQVAGELETAERTVKFHRANIMQKMRAKSLADLVRMAETLRLTADA